MRALACVLLLGVAGCFFKPDAPGGSDGSVNPTADAYLGPNYMFVTKSAFMGTEIADPVDADAKCQQAATAADLPGIYVAWISRENGTPVIHAKDRLGSARGWIRADKEPFADKAQDILDGRIFTPPRKDEYGDEAWGRGAVPNPEEFVYTGTDPTGVASGDDCASGVVSPVVTIGSMEATYGFWTNVGTLDCSNDTFHLYCFGTSYEVEVNPALPPGMKTAFVTDAAHAIDTVNGVAGWDAACSSASAAFRAAPGSYVAFVAGLGISARSRLSSNTQGWYRVDGIKLVDDHLFERFNVPLNVTENETYETGYAFSGVPAGTTDLFGTPGDGLSTCQNWRTNDINVFSAGEVQRSERSMWWGTNRACNSSNFLYCFEQ